MANNPNPNPNPNPRSTVATGNRVTPPTLQDDSDLACYGGSLFGVFLLCFLIGKLWYDYASDVNHIKSSLNITSASLSYYNNNVNFPLHTYHDINSPLQTYYDITFNFTMYNPHRKSTLEYLDVQAQAFYSDNFFSHKEPIPTFSLAKHKSTFFPIEYLVQPKPELNQELLETRKANGVLVFGVHVQWQIKLDRLCLNDVYFGRQCWTFLAKCDDIRLSFGNATTTEAFMLGEPKQCSVDWILE